MIERNMGYTKNERYSSERRQRPGFGANFITFFLEKLYFSADTTEMKKICNLKFNKN